MANASATRGFDAGLANGAPPPSTLAAQLVEDISPSTKSSRSDENAELKSHFCTIQRVKDNPDLLKTPEERIEHNHMLIYVYTRAVLENVKLDDPFLDRIHVRAEVLKAINFLRFTVKETPSVLTYRTNGEGFLFRGQEPLWIWLLPQLLRMLGHPQCLELQGSIEGFLQYIFLVVSRSEALREMIPSLGLYHRASLTGLLDHLQDASLPPSHKDAASEITLPPTLALAQILGPDWAHTTRYTAYTVPRTFQALRQAYSLARVLAYPVTSNDPSFSAVPWPETGGWLLDALMDLRLVQKRWEASSLGQPMFVIEMLQDILNGTASCGEISGRTREKAYTQLIMRCAKLLERTIHKESPHTPEGSHQLYEFQDEQVSKWADMADLNPGDKYQPRHLSKKTKLSSSGIDVRNLVQEIYRALQVNVSIEEDDPGVFQERFLGAFGGVDEASQCFALGTLSRGFCVVDETVSTALPSPKSFRSPGCSICSLTGGGAPAKPSGNTYKGVWYDTFSNLVRSPAFLDSRRTRIVAMQALKTMVLHCETPDFLSLETSGAGQWCIQSLSSSVRELRIAAGRTLMAFLIPNPATQKKPTIPCELFARNRQNVIALLKSISEKQNPRLTETCIMTWGQLGRVVKEDELNLVLIQLLEYLGDSNNVVSAFAFNEILKLSESFGTTPRRLLDPYWRNLAYLVTRDMVRRPQRSRAVAELLQLSVNELLLLIQAHALPWLVLYKKKDIIQKIAEARQESESWRPLMDSMNLATTLSRLLVQETEDLEGFAKSCLVEISPHFEAQPLSELLRSEPVLTILELLKAAGDADTSRKAPPRRALQTMAALVATNSKEKNRKGNVIGRFLQPYLLGLMARFTDVISDSMSTNPPIMEQRRCILAMDEMIRLCHGYSRIARPQISACLMSALPQDSLRGEAFVCWSSMITNLEEEDVEALLETTFFIVHRYWTSLDTAGTGVVDKMMRFLLSSYEPSLTRYITKLPSLCGLSGLEDVEAKLNGLRPALAPETAFDIFAQRIRHDSSGVVHLALSELVPYLKANQSALYASVISQRPDSAITTLLRALLDCTSKYNGIQPDISRLCMECLGLVGCLDSNQVETVREQRSIVILSNFEVPEEGTDFSLFVLEEVLVPAFLSATDTRIQGFLSYAMQELLDRCDVKAACAMQNTGMLGGNDIYRKWTSMPETVREVLTPFLSSRYVLAPLPPVNVEYPIFVPGKPYANWLRSLVIDLLRKGQNPVADMIFEPLTRVIRVKDLSPAEFLLPYLLLHVLLGKRSTEDEKRAVLAEIERILAHRPADDAPYAEKEDKKRYYHSVFRVLDYAMRWVQHKRAASRLSPADKVNVESIQNVLDSINPDQIAQCAIDCNDYARALFHLEHHAQNMEHQKGEPGERTELLQKLQDIYANIDEPDGLEGISAHLPALDIKQQILSHKKAGRWTAAQTWYEMQLAEKPENPEVQLELLHCLKQAGQHDVLLNHVDGIRINSSNVNKITPFAVEAAWVTSRWESLEKFTSRFNGSVTQDFNISIASIFQSLRRHCDGEELSQLIADIRENIATSMNTSATASLQSAHEQLLKCHVLTDLEFIVGAKAEDEAEHRKVMELLEGRLNLLGAYSNDKQYILGIRRAAMEVTKSKFSDTDISALWLSSARLARKTNLLHQSFNAVLHASKLDEDAATIENAKLLWRDNHHRKAIQILQGAIERNKFMTQTGATGASSSVSSTTKLTSDQKLLTARAQLLLAKWLDAAGQTHATALREKYQQPPKTMAMWEKGHYYLGRHYKKVLEAEKPLPSDDQTDNYVTGEIARLVIENYLRSLNNGTKYLYQTLPRILTLWLDTGAQVDKPPDGKMSLTRELQRRRLEQLNLLHAFLDKYIHRLPAYVFYTALPQIVARIAHPNQNVFQRLTQIIVKVVEAYPRQALWSLIGIMTTRQVSERKARGTQILQTLRNGSKNVEGASFDVKGLIRMVEKLAGQLLGACHNGDFQGNKTVHASLTRDLRFNHKCTPCPLVVPAESLLTATLPAVSQNKKRHKAFSSDVVTIDCFLDDVLVLSSLAKPRRLTARGTDGKNYMLLIKPKDDLRTDQRLMEFNSMINRSLKRDAESSRRQLYIRTYAVTPLNEECGIIEWVPGIKTIRDILLNLYSSRKIYPDYMTLKQLMEEASVSESRIRIFTDDVMGRFPPVLQLWFMHQFPNPAAWFAARLRYTRSCAVMSMVGTILGLGDRHGENVNLEEGNGGVFHVDFNCLFDKGLTFAKPERVPFRLTNNMVAAMGVHGYEGPFRKSSELTLSILRQQEETLMTILESFIYDPTLDLQKDKRASRKADSSGVKLQPQSVVDSIKRKVSGLLPNETIPLGVEGQVDELIKQAVDPRNLTAMYIGWCPFL
ncbi:serine/threonine-protein kinase ATR [Geosmithia morbida]|uniref:Serine/threonine-protein kinase MEC1 n=1 Tax=Geosmithia morbida TaxID=1094350 RepID=A0A9P5D208_9HYPO|nr:serine/threonine-protein kinase ATR [Geosmithia morbida]KAF4124503.1 serine/threonine-protein kinase ATR [Geosmithia morbida]